ncbi:MAG: hypothetical protein Q9227_000209 [Pyrenula ochraceoflavens]
MTEKESGLVEEPQFPPIWKFHWDAAGSRQYRHCVTNVAESSPAPTFGGILADVGKDECPCGKPDLLNAFQDMGLGKTLSATCAINSQCRWCLTGTPIQNSLDDYGALLSFLGVSPLTEKSMFDFWIATPMKEQKAHSLKRLQDLIRATCLRRTKQSVNQSLELPKRLEKTEAIDLHPLDRELYDFFKDITATIAENNLPKTGGPSKYDDFKDSNILSLINFLRLICNHGADLLPPLALAAWNTRDRSSVDWQMMQKWRSRCDLCNVDIGTSILTYHDNARLSCEHTICASCARQNTTNSTEEAACAKCAWERNSSVARDNRMPITGYVRHSAKVEVLLRNLRQAQPAGHDLKPQHPPKSVIFSYWTKMLDLIQKALDSEGFCLQRIDGKTSLDQRREAIRQFTHNPGCSIMLASIGSAGEGIDLTAANSVHLIEPHWNPMAEAQAVDRIHRIGQTREVTVYRYIVNDSVETVRSIPPFNYDPQVRNADPFQYIQWVQQDKLRLISQSLDFKDVSQTAVDKERWNVSHVLKVEHWAARGKAYTYARNYAQLSANWRKCCSAEARVDSDGIGFPVARFQARQLRWQRLHIRATRAGAQIKRYNYWKRTGREGDLVKGASSRGICRRLRGSPGSFESIPESDGGPKVYDE